jgi:hypothetical protein
MRHQQVRNAWLLACRVIGLAVLLSPLPLSAGPPTWVEIRSPHFVVVTDGGEKRGREVALRRGRASNLALRR